MNIWKYSASVDFYEKQAVPEANTIIDQSTRSYKAGALDYLDYVLSLNRAIEIRQNYLDALNNLNLTLINIEYITGKTILNMNNMSINRLFTIPVIALLILSLFVSCNRNKTCSS